MPWNAKAEARRLGPGIPTSDSWASAKEGIDQVGCVYTAQGFEFDYVAVIVGPDLVYRPMDGGWIGQREESRDRIVSRGVTDGEFTRFVKSTYRVLLTRGPRRLLRLLRGCPDPRLLPEPDRASLDTACPRCGGHRDLRALAVTRAGSTAIARRSQIGCRTGAIAGGDITPLRRDKHN